MENSKVYEIKILAATGMLGTGFSEDSFYKGLEQRPDVIGCDAGTSDSGPYYLATGKTMASKTATKRDLSIMLEGAIQHGIPLLIGSAGTGGSNAQVDWTTEIIKEIAAEKKLNFKLAKIYSEINNDVLVDYFNNGKITALQNAPVLTVNIIKGFLRVVGLMGPQPYIDALRNGAQVVVAGRSSDTSIYSAVPIMKGLDNGLVWHAAKILECGAGCVEKRIHPDCMFAWIYKDHFRVEAPNPKMRCTPLSVLSHMLYENSDPYHLYEPSGMLDVTESTYDQEGERGVIVKGSKYIHSERYTIRLEAVEHSGFRKIAIGGIRDPIVIRQLNDFLGEALKSIRQKVKESLNLKEGDYQLLYKVYGNSGVLGASEPYKGEYGHEVGLVLESIAPTSELSDSIMAVAWHTILHFPVKEWSGLVSHLAFPYSPPDIDAGPVYRFAMNHIVEVKDPCELFEINYITL